MRGQWLGIALVFWSALPAAAEPVLARWGGGGGNVLVEVRGFDANGMLRIAPTDGATGEALLPISEVGDLRFQFSESYREAQLRVSIGRPAEGLYLLESEVPAFVPYAVLADSNVPSAVRLYLRLLQHTQAWPEAVAVGAALTQTEQVHPLTADVLILIENLIGVGRIDDAAWLLSRVPLDADGADRIEVERVAHEMRRAGFWREAQTIYRRLADAAGTDPEAYWASLIAYCAWHLNEPNSAIDLVRVTAAQPAHAGAGLLGILRGRVGLAQGDTSRALDSLAATLIAAPANSEWRLELLAVLADAYEARGNASLSAQMRADLARLYPDSRWSVAYLNR
jgi:thioredoxin-like negative regulator of GroEL